MTETEFAEPAAPASRRRRLRGWLVDYAVVMVPAVALVLYSATEIVRGMPGSLGAVTEPGWARLILPVTGDGVDAGLSAPAMRERMMLAAPLVAALLAVPLLQFTYHAVFLSWRGRTLGNVVSGTRVDTGGSRAAALRRAFTTAFVETGLFSLACVALVAGRYRVATVICACAVLAFWLSAFLALGPGRRSLADHLGATVVTRHSPWTELAPTEPTQGDRRQRATPALGRTVVMRAAGLGRKSAAAAAAATSVSQIPSGTAAVSRESSAATVEFGDGFTDGRFLAASVTYPSAGATGTACAAETACATGPSAATGLDGLAGPAGGKTSELAAAAGRRAREGAESLATSPAGQRAQALGAADGAQAPGLR